MVKFLTAVGLAVVAYFAMVGYLGPHLPATGDPVQAMTNLRVGAATVSVVLAGLLLWAFRTPSGRRNQYGDTRYRVPRGRRRERVGHGWDDSQGYGR